jgi:hypothetical protein
MIPGWKTCSVRRSNIDREKQKLNHATICEVDSGHVVYACPIYENIALPGN